jgi:DNA-binding FadR family transcriptional regulator
MKARRKNAGQSKAREVFAEFAGASVKRAGRRERRKRPHNAIAEQIGVAILAGELAPGDTLANEDEASATLKVSRGAYREAIRTLAAKGLVQSRPKAGTKVCARGRWNLLDLDVLSWLFAREPDEKIIRDLFGLRMVIEPAAARLAAKAWTDHGFEALRQAMDMMVASEPSSEAWQQADKDFHETVIRLADNSFFTTLSAAISAAVRLTTKYKLRRPASVRNSTVEHLRVYEAIRSRDEELAGAQVEKLIRSALQSTLDERRASGKQSLKAAG